MKKCKNTSKWNALECALLAMLAACLLVGAAALKTQDQLQQKMIRLHVVVANSDSDRDQAQAAGARQGTGLYGADYARALRRPGGSQRGAADLSAGH